MALQQPLICDSSCAFPAGDCPVVREARAMTQLGTEAVDGISPLAYTRTSR
jgi:hypothetical protein